MSHLVRILRFVMNISRDIPRVRFTILLVMIAGLISGVANTGLIVLINQAVSGAGLTGMKLGVAFAGLCLGLPLFRFISQTLLVRLTQKTLYHLRMRWCRRILTLPLRTLEQVGPARLLASLTNDLGAITDALLTVPLLVMHVGVAAAALVYLGWLSGTLLLALLGFMVFGLVTYQLPMLWAIGYQRRARSEWDVLFEHIRAVTDGVKELKMHRSRRQALLDRRLDPSADALQRHITTATAIFNAASSWGQILFFVAIGLLLFVYPRFQAVPQEVLTGYSITLIAMMTPLELMLTSLPRLTNASIAIRRVDELGLSLWNEAPERDAGAVAPGWERIELAGVTHTYPGEVETETFTLGPLDLTLTPGELVFVVGGNGSGKTTLAKLLLGLYEPESGEVRLDGETVTAENRDRYRQHFSAVFSDFFLFNSLLGLDGSRLDEDARRYLRQLQLDRKVRIEGGDLSTTDLSQGQRKRLALLTAYLEDRPIYLFDEWAADQDPTFKEVFYRQILPELKARGKTVVVISHDDRYYHVADRVLKLVYGQVESDLRPAAALAAGA
ncbi:MAG TPA: cyclic peptide export ABC transporter [Thermoanaerobaculia bacterium]|nr:cyclic peptide export ABC transporter [Thermoanaerobaculia bacterium]